MAYAIVDRTTPDVPAVVGGYSRGIEKGHGFAGGRAKKWEHAPRSSGRRRGRARIPAKIYHKPRDPLYKAIEAVAVEARSGVRNA